MAGVEEVHETESGAILAFTKRVVVKMHRAGTNEDALQVRLNWAAHPDLAGVLVPPLSTNMGHIRGRPVTSWPRVETLNPDDEPSIPWFEAARLLARLHLIGRTLLAKPATTKTSDSPDAGAIARVHRTLRRVDQALASTPHLEYLNLLNRVGRALTGELASATTDPGSLTLIHGDFHAGQLGRIPGADWQLIDIDDLGVGDPAWDLARPAGLWAAGLLPDGLADLPQRISICARSWRPSVWRSVVTARSPGTVCRVCHDRPLPGAARSLVADDHRRGSHSCRPLGRDVTAGTIGA